ncbi:MAG: 3-oxoacyl-[acyl-carrier-protein] synthase-3 [Porticoccaceae bacterium]|jgi:3-oxoacyl-[acyl-carrier-protein] synthase-3
MVALRYKAKISGVADCFPDDVVTNLDLEKIFGVSDDWIQKRTGIRERRKLKDDQQNSDLGAEAGLAALKQANLDPLNVDMIVYCTNTPDKLLPATACIAQAKIGAHNASAFDLVSACAGWIFGLSTAQQFISSGRYENILVIGAEALSRFLNWEDRDTCILFGDGASATVVSRANIEDKSEILSVHMHSDGRQGHILDIPAGGSELPSTIERVQKGENKIRMRGKEIFRFAVREMCNSAHEALAFNDLTLDDVDWFIPHQANLRIIEAVGKKLKLPDDKIIINVDRYGNTSSATIPAALKEGVEMGKIKRGDLLLMSTFGGGLSWGSALMYW